MSLLHDFYHLLYHTVPSPFLNRQESATVSGGHEQAGMAAAGGNIRYGSRHRTRRQDEVPFRARLSIIFILIFHPVSHVSLLHHPIPHLICPNVEGD